MGHAEDEEDRLASLGQAGGSNVGTKTGDECVEVEGTIEAETPKAYLFVDDMTGKQVWLPKSQIVTETDQGGGKVTFEIKEWIAKKNGLI